MAKIKVILFEGIDGSGKSTVIKELNKKCKYKYICVDRFTGSSFCYDRNKEEDILAAEQDLVSELASVEFYLVYLYCDKRELINRLKNKNDEDKIKKIERDRKRYNEYLKKTHFNNVAIDTTFLDVDEVVEMIIEFVEDKDDK